MNSRVAVAGVAFVVALLTVAAAPRDERKGVLAPLEVGQQVGLREAANGYTINVVPGTPLGNKVVEVGTDYVVLEDAAGLTQTRIPVTSLRAVIVTRLPREK
jgi:hypothetical protein